MFALIYRITIIKQVQLPSAMARTKGKKNITPCNTLTNSPHTPDVIHNNNLPPLDKLIVYYYWIYIKIEGKQGWDPERSGFKEQWSLLDVHSHYTTSQFYTRGKVNISMVLASF